MIHEITEFSVSIRKQKRGNKGYIWILIDEHNFFLFIPYFPLLIGCTFALLRSPPAKA